MNTIKKWLYHHDLTAKMYNVIRKRRRDKYHHVPDEKFAKQCYFERTGRILDLDNPKNYDEKLWYLKFHMQDPLMTKCSDKYKVREYIRECGLESILNELYGVYDSFEQIPFDSIPSPCIIKCNHTSGVNVIFDRNKPFDYEYYKHEFNFFLKQNYYKSYREWNYKDIEPKIICERLLKQPGKSSLDDYRFMCFDGEVKFVLGEIGMCREDGSHNPDAVRNVYDRDFNLMPDVRFSRNTFPPELLPKPVNYDKMVEYAEILSKPFRHIRVDLYNLEGEIYFGELTFYHQGGCCQVTPEEFYYQAGEWINIDGLE